MVEKLARETARLAFWRKPVEASPDAAAPAAASASVVPTAADAPKPGWFARLKQKLQRGKELAAPAPAAVPVQAVVATPTPPPVEVPPPPPPPLVTQQLEEMLELSDPVAPSAHKEMMFGDDTLEEDIQALDSSEVAQAHSIVADSSAAAMDSLQSEADPATAEIAQAETAQAEVPQANQIQPEAAPEEGDESHKPKLVSRLLGTLSKKWVWIPSVSVAMLTVMSTLSFMLMQSKQTTHELQTELASAKKQLKQVPIKPEMVPPLLVAHQNVASHEVNHAAASPKEVSREEVASQSDAGSSPSSNVDMDCAISDKASVAKNLKNCIEAFNQASAR